VSTKRPIHEIRLGRIQAAIWANQSQGQMWFNVTIARSFQENGEWKESSGFRRDDLPIVAKLAEMAYAWIWSQGSSATLADSRHLEANP
jgi:hypothetical protein